jgi:arylsulfatase
VDGEEVAKGPIEHTVPTRFSLDETFDIGMDTGTPVVEDYEDKMPFKFTGALKKVVIELGKSGLEANAEKKLKEQAEKLARAVE